MNVMDKLLWMEHSSWNYREIRLHSKTDGRVPAQKLRVEIRRNAYDDQSQASCDIWTNGGWKNVIKYPIQSCLCKTVSYVQKDPDISLFEQDAEMLFLKARTITT